jgi:arsenate reductase
MSAGHLEQGRQMRRIAEAMRTPLLLSSVFAGVLSAQRATVNAPRTVVFVCEHGTVKSVIALEYFNRLARARGLDITAISRGTAPDSAVPAAVRSGLRRDGFDVAHFQPRRLGSADLASAMLIVTLDADLEPWGKQFVPVDRWDGLPSVMSDYANGRSAIVKRVGKLVDSLERTRSDKR